MFQRSKILKDNSINEKFSDMLTNINELYNLNLTNEQLIELNKINSITNKSYQLYIKILDQYKDFQIGTKFMQLQIELFNALIHDVNKGICNKFSEYKSIE